MPWHPSCRVSLSSQCSAVGKLELQCCYLLHFALTASHILHVLCRTIGDGCCYPGPALYFGNNIWNKYGPLPKSTRGSVFLFVTLISLKCAPLVQMAIRCALQKGLCRNSKPDDIPGKLAEALSCLCLI